MDTKSNLHVVLMETKAEPVVHKRSSIFSSSLYNKNNIKQKQNEEKGKERKQTKVVCECVNNENEIRINTNNNNHYRYYKAIEFMHGN